MAYNNWNISVITLFPDLYNPFFNISLLKKAKDANILSLNLVNLFDFSINKKVDSQVLGSGSGMLIKPDVLEKAFDNIDSKYSNKSYKIFFSPQGKKLDQNLLKDIYEDTKDCKNITLVTSRYEGFDARSQEYYADLVISIGDFVSMSGDLPAMIFIESFSRLIPGVINKKDSVENDSFYGPFVDYPQYTHPIKWKGLDVPNVILSGNHLNVDIFREKEAIRKSIESHFHWVKNNIEDKSDIIKAKDFIPNHYAILMHNDVILENGREGTSSVTSLDIHDIARSAKTFGIKKYFIVTRLADQQEIVNTLLNFWKTDIGKSYNSNRSDAIEIVDLKFELDDVLKDIKNLENGLDPILISTSAKAQETNLGFNDQDKLWSLKRPIIFIFGTARGLSSKILDMSDYLLPAIKGFSEFNHLSVRSAAAIIFDRWLGINLKPKIRLK